VFAGIQVLCERLDSIIDMRVKPLKKVKRIYISSFYQTNISY